MTYHKFLYKGIDENEQSSSELYVILMTSLKSMYLSSAVDLLILTIPYRYMNDPSYIISMRKNYDSLRY